LALQILPLLLLFLAEELDDLVGGRLAHLLHLFSSFIIGRTTAALEQFAHGSAEFHVDLLNVIFLIVGDVECLGHIGIGERLWPLKLVADLLESFGLLGLQYLRDRLVSFLENLLGLGAPLLAFEIGEV